MSSLEQQLARELAELDRAGLRRSLRIITSAQGTCIRSAGRQFINFSSNDYLGLANHPKLKQAAQRAIDSFGAGTGASRLISGSNTCFHELETTLARFKETEGALVFSTGYTATLGTLPCLVAKGDVILIDRLAHASIIDAARLSGATLRVFKHNDMDHLKKQLQRAAIEIEAAGTRSHISPGLPRGLPAGSRPARILIATESIFSMDGDTAPLDDIVQLKNDWNAFLFLDDAHATGICGPQGKGWAHARGLAGQVDVNMGTLSKACGSSGGFVSGTATLVEFLIHRARTFLFSTAPLPASAAAAQAALELIGSHEGDVRRTALWDNIRLFSSALRDVKPSQSAIFPLFIGAEQKASAISQQLLKEGFLVPAIRYPTVARGKARLRISLSADHTSEQISALVMALQSAGAFPAKM